MRTNIEIDDDLVAEAMKAAGVTTKREAVQAGLETLVRLKAQQKIRDLRGNINWVGDLEEMRRD